MDTHTLRLTCAPLTLDALAPFVQGDVDVVVDEALHAIMQRGRRVVEKIVNEKRLVYGVNTGFGKFAEVPIPSERVADLQQRLILSHAAGVGPPLPIDLVRLLMLLKIKALSQGHSGCRPKIVDLLTAMLNRQIIPVIPMKGSVGASGDLAPLAHLALVMLGAGQAWTQQQGQWVTESGHAALAKAGLTPITFEAKEGLAMLNGTQAMTAYTVWSLLQTRNLLKTADICGALSLEALLGTLVPFDVRIHELRPHPGQLQVAANVRRMLTPSPIVASHRDSAHKVQDAYSLRCMPQVHGAVRDAVTHVEAVVTREINAVTDNPLVFPEANDVLSGGNFHGEPVALAADYLGIALAELASIAERRIAHLIDPAVSELPGFLVAEGGLNSGFMLAQVTAAALVSENKVLSHPASVDSIPTSANKEDHVSMGTLAAYKATDIVKNVEHVLAIELLCAVQALDLREAQLHLAPSQTTAAVRDLVRSRIPFWDEDRLMHHAIEEARALIATGRVAQVAETACGALY
jgi:histidine ammonia-lyase